MDRAEGAVDKLKDALRLLNNKIEEAKRKKNILIARKKRAEAQRQIASTMQGLGDTSAFDTFDRMADRINLLEAEAEAGRRAGRRDLGPTPSSRGSCSSSRAAPAPRTRRSASSRPRWGCSRRAAPRRRRSSRRKSSASLSEEDLKELEDLDLSGLDVEGEGAAGKSEGGGAAAGKGEARKDGDEAKQPPAKAAGAADSAAE